MKWGSAIFVPSKEHISMADAPDVPEVVPEGAAPAAKPKAKAKGALVSSKMTYEIWHGWAYQRTSLLESFF